MGEQKEKENGGATVVLKADFHCDGCASKIIKTIRRFDGWVAVDGQKITVEGKVDPAKLLEKVVKKSHKKVELVSPQLKKDGDSKENAKGKENNSGHNGKKEEKEPPVTTAVLKLNLHCDGCIDRIYKTVTKTKGYKEMKFDHQKDLVTVTGAIDMKALAKALQKKLRREVAIVPPKMDGQKKEDGNGGVEKVEGNKMQSQAGYPYPFIYGPFVTNVGDQFHYNPYAAQYHAPQLFSDENPNSCNVM